MEYKRQRNYKEKKRNEVYCDSSIFSCRLFYKQYVTYKKLYDRFETLFISLIIASGEIPTDIYEMLNICNGTFRAAISALYKMNLIKRNFCDSIHTYVLSAHGKSVFSYYTPFIRTTNILSSRKRHIKLARLNAFLLGLGTDVFFDNYPTKEDVICYLRRDDFRFINSYILKPMVTNFPEQIMRSKAYGVITACECQYLVYYESVAVDFYYEEELFRRLVSNFTGKEVTDMLIMVDSLAHAAFWNFFLLNHYDYFYGDNPAKYFTSVKFLAIDSYADENFYALLNEQRIIENFIQQYSFFNRDDNKKYHLFITLDFVKLRYLTARSQNCPDEKIIIIASPYLFELIRCLTKDVPIEVYCLKEDVWNDFFE